MVDKKYILSRYLKKIYQATNGVLANLVSIKEFNKRHKREEDTLYKVQERAPHIRAYLSDVLLAIQELFEWIRNNLPEDKLNKYDSIINSGKIILHKYIEHKERSTDYPLIFIDKEELITMKRHISGRGIITYKKANEKEPSEVTVAESFNDVVVVFGLEVQWINREITAFPHMIHKIKVNELINKLTQIQDKFGDIELEDKFTVHRGKGFYQANNTGTIDETIRFCDMVKENNDESK